MNTVGYRENCEFLNPFNPPKLDSRLIIHRVRREKRPDMIEIVAWALIAPQGCALYSYIPAGEFIHTASDGTETKTWREAYKSENPSEYGRCRFDYELPLELWEAFNDEQAVEWVKGMIQTDIDDNNVYGYWIEKR
jgi:hypothetical protein